MFIQEFGRKEIIEALPEIMIKIEDDVRKELYERALSEVASEGALIRILSENSSKYGSTRSIRYHTTDLFRTGYSDIPIWMVHVFCDLASYPYQRIEDSMIRYGISRNKVYGKLRIRHSPEFDYINGILNSSARTEDGVHFVKSKNAEKILEIGGRVFGKFDLKEKNVGPQRDTKQFFLPYTISKFVDALHPFPEFPSMDEPLENILAYLSGVISCKGGEIGTSFYKKDTEFRVKVANLLEFVGCDSRIYDTPTTQSLVIPRNNVEKLLGLLEEHLPAELLPDQFKMMEKVVQIYESDGRSKADIKSEAIKVLRREPISRIDLAFKLRIETASAYKLVKKLERQNLVRRVGTRIKMRRPAVLFVADQN